MNRKAQDAMRKRWADPEQAAKMLAGAKKANQSKRKAASIAEGVWRKKRRKADGR